METRISVTEAAITVEVSGRLDSVSSPVLSNEIKKAVEGSTARSLVLDFRELQYISSAGLRTVLAAQNWMNLRNGSLTVCNLNRNIRNIFKVTGFDTFLRIL